MSVDASLDATPRMPAVGTRVVVMVGMKRRKRRRVMESSAKFPGCDVVA